MEGMAEQRAGRPGKAAVRGEIGRGEEGRIGVPNRASTDGVQGGPKKVAREGSVRYGGSGAAVGVGRGRGTVGAHLLSIMYEEWKHDVS